MGLDRCRRHAVAAGVGLVVPRHACFGAAVRPTRCCTVLFHSRFASSVPPLRPHSVRSMSLTHVERLRAAGCGLKCKLISLGMHRTTTSTATSASTTVTAITACMTAAHQTRYFEPQSNGRARHKLMQSCVLRVASKPMAALRGKAANNAEELCTSGQCAAGAVTLHRAIYLGDVPSRALKAWLLLDGRESVAEDQKEALELAEEGAR
jgi:hypothetical protein